MGILIKGLSDQELEEARREGERLKEYFRAGRIAQGIVECPECKGHGRVGVMACFRCGATGLITQ